MRNIFRTRHSQISNTNNATGAVQEHRFGKGNKLVKLMVTARFFRFLSVHNYSRTYYVF